MTRWLRAILDAVAAAWCYRIHPAPRLPVHGLYECPKCLRLHPVAWEQPVKKAVVQ
jgi:hypothetical protein